MARSREHNDVYYPPKGDDDRPNEVKWRKWRVNALFIEQLQKDFGTSPFTNNQAYATYVNYRPKFAEEAKRWMDSFGESLGRAYFLRTLEFSLMNIRNDLSTCAYRGLLTRIRPGVYKFNYFTYDV